MFNPLSYIIGYISAWRVKRQQAMQSKIDEQARNLFLKMLAEHEDDEVQRKLADLEERKKLADAWMPFKTKKMTKGQAKALSFLDDAQIIALDVIDEEIRGELSNRALRADGIARDKAMWAAVGVRMYVDAIKQRIESYGGRQQREDVKRKIESEKSEKTVVRTIKELYGDQLISTQ